ncbi:hypothetical protein [Sphingomonas lenta]|nr:hypothetical protein [Sphingomonas lenta]
MNALFTSERVDAARSAATLFFAAAQPIAGQAARLTGRGEPIEEQSAKAQSPVTPADGAFVIWAPLFAASLNYAARAVARSDDPLIRRTGWLTAAAYAGDTAWELWAQYRNVGWRSVAIIAATAGAANAAMLTAARAEEDEPSRDLVLNSVAPLAGWLTVATAANLGGARIAEGGPADRPAQTRVGVALTAAAATAASVLSYASRGNPFYAGAAAWGLGGVAVRNLRERNGPVLVAALAGLAAAAGATFAARRRA